MVRLEREWRLPEGASVIMLPGRLTSWKGQSVLIDALAQLRRPDLCAVLVGADQGRRRYAESLIAKPPGWAWRTGCGWSASATTCPRR